MRVASVLLLSSLLLGVFATRLGADVPTVEQMCQIDNAARCELNGSISLYDKPCPAGMKTIQPYRGTQCPPAKTESAATAEVEPARPTKSNPWFPFIALLVVITGALAWRIRVNMKQGASLASLVTRWGVTFVFSVGAGLAAARYAFYKIFERMPNKDTFVPGLLALAIAGVAFFVISALVGALVQRVFKKSK